MKSEISRENNSDQLARALFLFSLTMMIFAYGYCAHRFKLFPHSFIEDAIVGFTKVEATVKEKRSWFYRPTPADTKAIANYDKSKAYQALSFTTSIAENSKMYVRVIDLGGKLVQEWAISWHEVWPDATHVPSIFLPKEDPGTHIHGAVIMDNGDVVFNFEHLGLVRLDPCGEVVWRLPYRTHHSVYQDEAGDLWVSGQIDHDAKDPKISNYEPYFIEPTILKVSPEGEVLVEKSVIELLQENQIHSLLYMTTTNELSMSTRGDTLHLNDIEVFPSSMPEGVFRHGDIMISLRNVSSILVFDSEWKLKYQSIGAFLRQHDPDFIDGNTISIYDNNNIGVAGIGRHSRILIESADTGEIETYFMGSKEKPFFSLMMGKHQWLPNGNLLITDSMKGRAFELDEESNIVWEFTNVLADGYSGIVEEVTRLPGNVTADFFEQSRQACSGS